MRYLFAFIAAYAVVLSPIASADVLTVNAAVQEDLHALIDTRSVRAATVGLYDNGKTRVTGFGQLSGHTAAKPNGDTVFEIGSITKVFTALLAQVQVDAGHLDWDDPIEKFFPDTDFAMPEVADITLRELASHTSGLPRLPDNMDPEDPLNPYAGYGVEDLLAFLSAYRPDALVKEYNYSNLGAGLLGVIAASASDSTYADALARDVWKPFGLADTSVGPRAAQRDRLAAGYSDGADMPNWTDFDALAGAGAIFSTTADLLRFARANLEPDDIDASLAAIRVPQGDGKTGLGWHLRNVAADDTIYWHNGGTGGYASFLAVRPKTGTGVVILAASTEYAAVTELGFAQITGQVQEKPAIDLAPFTGAYRLSNQVVLTVFAEKGRLYGQATGQGAFPLTPHGDNEFVFPAADIRIVFDDTGANKAPGMTFHQGGQITEAPRVADEQGPQVRKAIVLAPDALADYVGKYRLASSAVITITAKDSQLFAQLTGQPAVPVFAYEPDRFFYKVVDARLTFERNDAGEVVAVVLDQLGEQRAAKVD